MKSNEHLHVVEEQVTPAKAASWIEGNTDNRPLSDRRIKQYAADMTAGKWRLTHQPIALTDDGRLLDGQHRLWAIVESEQTVPMMVARNCDPETFAVIDGGKLRSGSDTLAVAGWDMHNEIPGLLRMLKLYDEFRDEGWSNHNAKIPNDEIVAAAEKAGPVAVDATRLAVAIRGRAETGPQPTYSTAIYLIHRETGLTPAEQWDMFWENYATGVDLSAGDPRLSMKRSIMRLYLPKAGSTPMQNRVFLGLLLKGWNLFAKGKSSQVLSFKEGEHMPDVVTPRKRHQVA